MPHYYPIFNRGVCYNDCIEEKEWGNGFSTVWYDDYKHSHDNGCNFIAA